MDLELKGKVVVITGGAAGIGEAAVRLFAAEASSVVIAGRNRERGEWLTAELSAQGATVMFIEAELSEEMECRRVVDETLAKFGRLDVLVNNAGVNDSISLGRSPKEFMGSLQRSLLHVFAMTHFAQNAPKAA